jgi:hypothetical protein
MSRHLWKWGRKVLATYSLMTLHMIGAIYCDLLGGVKTPGQACAGFPHRGEVVDVTDGAPVVAYQAGTAAARKGDLAG